jgi:hypothetical protein
VLHGLAPIAALAPVGVGLVDGMKVTAQADLTIAHLCDDRADRSMCAYMCCEDLLSRTGPQMKECSVVFGSFSGLFLFRSYSLSDGGFRGCR